MKDHIYCRHSCMRMTDGLSAMRMATDTHARAREQIRWWDALGPKGSMHWAHVAQSGGTKGSLRSSRKVRSALAERGDP